MEMEESEIRTQLKEDYEIRNVSEGKQKDSGYSYCPEHECETERFFKAYHITLENGEQKDIHICTECGVPQEDI